MKRTDQQPKTSGLSVSGHPSSCPSPLACAEQPNTFPQLRPWWPLALFSVIGAPIHNTLTSVRGLPSAASGISSSRTFSGGAQRRSKSTKNDLGNGMVEAVSQIRDDEGERLSPAHVFPPNIEEKAVCCASVRAKKPQPHKCCPHAPPLACPMRVPLRCTTDGTYRKMRSSSQSPSNKNWTTYLRLSWMVIPSFDAKSDFCSEPHSAISSLVHVLPRVCVSAGPWPLLCPLLWSFLHLDLDAGELVVIILSFPVAVAARLTKEHR